MSKAARHKLIESAKETLLLNEAQADKAVRELIFLYDEAAYTLEGNINALVGRFADQNGLTQQMAKELLAGKEQSVWQKSIEEYCKELPKAGRGSKLELELNLLSAKSRISREEQLLGNIYRNIANLAGTSDIKLTQALDGIYRTNYYRSMFDVQRSFGYGFNIAKIDEKQLNYILNYAWKDRPFTENIWGKGDKIAGLVRREITLGSIQGSSVQEMAKAINDVMGKGKYEAERLVRTEAKRVASEGEIEGYKENGIEEYQFVGGDGSEKCLCQKVASEGPYKVAEAKVGDNLPPLHPNCLCITIAYFRNSMFEKRPDAVPLSENIKFKEWASKFA